VAVAAAAGVGVAAGVGLDELVGEALARGLPPELHAASSMTVTRIAPTLASVQGVGTARWRAAVSLHRVRLGSIPAA
jgi:hypothetical protein